MSDSNNIFVFGQKVLFVLPLKYVPRKGARKIVSKKMSISAMKIFARKVSGKKVEIIPYYNKLIDFTMFFIRPNCIAVNDNYFKRKWVDITEIKGSLLHELGHMRCKHKKSNSVLLISRQEFEAQLWAYGKAKELGLKKVMDFLYNDIVNWSKTRKRGLVYTACKMASKRWKREFEVEKKSL
jgi:hypothetical protein